MTLSTNVKQYFVHALKGVGMYHTKPVNGRLPEMNEKEIEELLDNPKYTPSELYHDIELSMVEQFKQDGDNGKYLQKKTAFDRKTADSMIEQIEIGGVIMNKQERDSYLNNVVNRVQNDATIESIIMTLCAGLADQKLSNSEKDEAWAFWEEIHYADFKTWLESPKIKQYQAEKFAEWLLQQRNGQVDPQSPYPHLLKRYRIEKVENKLKECTAEIYGANNEKFLNTKIPSKDSLQNLPAAERTKMEAFWQKLEANKELLDNSKRFCKARCEANELSNPDAEFCMTDVLAAAGNSSAQLIAFFQTRSNEQETKQKADPKNSDVTKENKIGNLMGETGRAYVKSATGGTGAAVSFDGELGMKKGRMGPWRGYKELFDRIMNFLQKDIYGNIPVIGFVMGMMERKGYGDFDPKEANVVEKKDLTKAWETDYKPIPNACKNEDGVLNAAGEFVNKTKARILADKMALAEKTAQIQDYDPNIDPEITNQQVKYLQERIKTAEKIYNEQKDLNPNSGVFNNPKYYAMMEEQIVAREAHKGNAGVTRFLDNTRAEDTDANQEMINALQTFNRMVHHNKETAVHRMAMREMAADMFNLRTKYKNGEITGADLDAMTDRFVHSNGYQQIFRDLNEKTPSFDEKMQNRTAMGQDDARPKLDSKDYKITAEQMMAAINSFAIKDLKENAKHEEYSRHQSEQYHEQFMHEALMER